MKINDKLLIFLKQFFQVTQLDVLILQKPLN